MNRSPDSIDRWLDVFVRLLRVPTHDAQRIRAELDDHLRARTHDLMVSGHTEPEAVRTAIAELGETAELARNFALARTSPRRRLVMQTAVLAVAGTAIAVGSAALLSSNAVPSSSQDAIAQAPVQPNETTDRGIAEAEPDPALFERDLVAHEGDFATLGDLVALLEETTGEKVIIPAIGVSEHPARYDEDSPLEPVELTGLTIQQGLNIVGRQFAFRPTDALVLNETDTALELAPQSFFDFRDAILIEYDIRDLLYPAQGEFIEPVDFAATVTSLIEPTLWDSATRGIPPRARMGVLSTTLLVNAHPRIHQQIEGLFDRIRSRYAAQEAQSLQTRRQGLIEEITRLEETLVERRARLEQERGRLPELEARRDELRVEAFVFEETMGGTTGEAAVRELIRLEALNSRFEEAQADVQQLSQSIERVQTALTQTERQLEATKGHLAQLAAADDD